MDLPLLVITTVGSRADADRLAQAMVQARLAACAQIEAIASVYRWKGQVEADDEWRVLFKTTNERYAALEAALREQHPYELPAIHALATTQAEAAYGAWVRESVDPSG